tara:strand:- start:4157 stop:4510 length:354 start_codon:yes stop_codon:yes gene_type:complete
MIWIHLPEDAKNIVKDYMVKEETIMLSKTYFNLYYDVPDIGLLRRLVLNVIRKDHDFVFNRLFTMYYEHFKKLVGYRYQGKRYKHFADFLKYRTIEQQSTKCKNILFEKLTNEYMWI